MASGRLIDYLGSGLAASRPATPTLASGSVGLWYSTDTDVLSAWDGATWEDVGGAGFSGDVDGPASATNNAITRFDGITGKLVQDSGVLLQDDDAIEGVAALQFDKQASNPATTTTQALYQDNGTNYDDGTLVWGNKLVILDEVSIGDPGNEQGSIQVNGISFNAILKVNEFNGAVDANTIHHRHSNSIPPRIAYARARGTDATHANVQAGDALGSLNFVGWHTNSYWLGAELTVEVDGTPSTTDMPTRWVFRVSPDGSATPAEAMRISADKSVRLAAHQLFAEIAAPATPATGYLALYAKTDGKIYAKNDAGTEYDLTDGGGATTFLDLTDTPASYSGQAGKVVAVNGTETGLEFITDGVGGNSITEGTYASIPVSPSEGDLFFVTDSPALLRRAASSWSTFGPISKLYPPNDGDFSWVNQGTSTITAVGPYLSLAPQKNAGINIRGRFKSTPATPYVVTALVTRSSVGSAVHAGGLAWRDSAGGGIHIVAIYNSTNVPTANVGRYTNVTTFSANDIDAVFHGDGGEFWVRLSDDGVNRKAEISSDNIAWVTLWTGARTTFITPDQIGWFADPRDATNDSVVQLLSWRET